MSVSGTSSLTVNRDMLIRRALRLVGAFPSTDLPRPEQLFDAINILNVMIKTWSLEGFLWLRQFQTISLTAGINYYLLGPGGTPAIERPLHVYNCNKKDTSGNEVPMISLTRQDWFVLPNKTSTGVPVQYYYDPQTINGTLYVWPTPQTGTTDKLVLDIDKQLDVMVDSYNDFDFPPQWYDAIAYGLAVRLAPEYGVPLPERQQLIAEASAFYLKASTDDRDLGSVKFEVRRQ